MENNHEQTDKSDSNEESADNKEDTAAEVQPEQVRLAEDNTAPTDVTVEDQSQTIENKEEAKEMIETNNQEKAEQVEKTPEGHTNLSYQNDEMNES